ncbi:2-haloalkanoic acid dehalogenase [Aureobasidium sp. EXF-10728]|nr:2-haloalkanoic acid dehalogenase [Aureobasidium sp. EXF-10728]
MPKHVVFDVVGTLVSYDAFFASIETVLGPRLLAQNLSPKLFGFAWLESSEREFTYLSISSRHKPYKTVFSAMFYRILWMSGIASPREFATDAERDEMVASYSTLRLRDGVQETFDLLRENGFEVWCLTTGDQERVLGYFGNAGVRFPQERFRSCDSSGVAKPALEAYRPLYYGFGAEDEKWFAAAHYWDVSAAKIVGFKGAYCSVYEKEDCKELFDVDMDVMADTLPEMAKKIIEASK